MIIMGFGKKTYDVLGETKPHKCENCSHERPFKYVKERTWFTLFFLQVFPIKERKLMVCPVCGAGFEAGDVAYVEKEDLSVDQMTKKRETVHQKIKEKFEKGEISRNEYVRLLNIIKFDTQQQA